MPRSRRRRGVPRPSTMFVTRDRPADRALPDAELPRATAGFDFGTAIQELYPVLGRVFEYLQVADLRNAAKVNDVWAEFAAEQLGRRRGAGKFEVRESRLDFELVKKGACDDVNAGFAIVFGDKRLRQYGEVRFQVLEGEAKDVKVPTGEAVPMLTAVQTGLLDPEAQLIGYLISDVLPKDDNIVCAGLVLPKIPGLVVEEYAGVHFMSSVSRAFKRGLELKALMYFTDVRCSVHQRSLKTELKYIRDMTDQPKFALAGGLVTGRMEEFFAKAGGELRAVQRGFQHAVAFLCPRRRADFEAHSVVVARVEALKEKLVEAQLNVNLKKHAVAVVYQCSGLDICYLNSEFKWHFPTVEFVAVTVEGEIGWDSYEVNNGCKEIPRKRAKADVEPTYLHTYSIVILFLCWD